MLFQRKREIRHYEITDRGLSRMINQDAITVRTEGEYGLFALSDGMGGHNCGELASHIVIEQCEEFWKEIEISKDFLSLVTELEVKIKKANRIIYENYNQGQICGATLVVLFVMKDCFAVLSAGDSRVYTYKKNKTALLTSDDIWDTLPSTRSTYSEVEIIRNRKSGKLVQSVGTKQDINLHVTTSRIIREQIFLLCSDGFYRYFNEEQLSRRLKGCHNEETMRDTIDKMVEDIYSGGAADNLSAIAVIVK